MASVSSSMDLWDPYRVLDVNPNNDYGTCVGFAVSTGARCRWKFNSEQFTDNQRDIAIEILESMSEKHPANITSEELYSLARNTLCRDFHQRYADAKSAEWRAKLRDYLRVSSNGRAVRQLQYEPNHANQLQNGIAKDKDASEREVLEMLKKVMAELEASRTLCAELTEKNNELDKRREDDQAANSWDINRLRQQLKDSQSDTKAVKEQKTTEVESLKKQLEGRNANFEKELKGLRDGKARLKKASTASILEISSLRAEVRDRDKMLDERTRTSKREADSLRQQLAASGDEVADLKEAKASSDEKAKLSEQEAESLRQQLAASGDEVADLKEAKASSDEKETESLRQQLAASGDEVADLKEAKASLDEKAQLSEKETESVRQELRESNVRHEALEAQSSQDVKELGEKFETLRKKYNESRNENAAQMSRLREQDRNIRQLGERMDVVKRDLARRDRDVEDLVKRMDGVKEELAEREEKLSALLPRDVKKGLFAVISRQPPRVLVRKISKIMRTESATYVQSAA